MTVEIKYLKLSEIKKNPDNPRIIRDEKFHQLKKSIQDFPEMLHLREIVVDENYMVLGGNQRYKALQELKHSDVIAKVVYGLSEEQKKEFIVKDNVNVGEWDFNVLSENYDSLNLQDWGIEIELFKKINKIEDGEIIEFEKSVQLEPPKEYILIMADPNSESWEEMKELLKLKMVRRGGYKKGSELESFGIERVLIWEDFKKRYVDSNTK